MRRLRWLAVLAALALAAAACGGGDDDGGEGAASGDLPECPLSALDEATAPVEVVVWHTQTARPGDTLTELAEEYNGSQDRVRVRLENQGANYQELQRKFEAAIASRQLPDLIVFDDTAVQLMADSGVVLPAQSCVDADQYDLSRFREVAVNYYTIDDVLWPASANLGNVLLYYNKSHFRAAGLDPEQGPQTLAEVREYAEKIKAAGVTSTPLVHEFASWKTEFWLTGDGAAVVDNDNGRGDGETTAAALADNPAALELFTWFEGMQADGLLNAIPRVDGQIDQYLALAQQNGSMLVESSSAATTIEAFLGGDTSVAEGTDLSGQNVSGLDLGAGVFPGLTTPGKTQMGGAAWYMLNANAPERQAASWDFMTFMNSVPAQAKMLTGGSYLPYLTAANDDPTAQAFYEGGLSGRWLRIANDQIDDIDPAFPGPLIGPYFDFREALEDAQDDLMFAGAAPQQALDDAQTTVTDALTVYNEQGF
jgi:sn-glycerol 3-phosphate transport system substrate-binding protein